MINRVLIVDTETTGLAPHSSQVIEIGAILYSVKHQTTLQQMSILLPADGNPQEKVNRIKSSSLQDLPVAVPEIGLTRVGQNLVHLALAHGIGVSLAHRALADCQLIAALFDRMDDLQSMFRWAMRPKGRFVAQVSYDDRNIAKEHGFRWLPERKTWERTMAISDTELLPFAVKQVDHQPRVTETAEPW